MPQCNGHDWRGLPCCHGEGHDGPCEASYHDDMTWKAHREGMIAGLELALEIDRSTWAYNVATNRIRAEIERLKGES